MAGIRNGRRIRRLTCNMYEGWSTDESTSILEGVVAEIRGGGFVVYSELLRISPELLGEPLVGVGRLCHLGEYDLLVLYRAEDLAGGRHPLRFREGVVFL